jgi:RNA polymerase sigma-70 factor (ECF subfamily)
VFSPGKDNDEGSALPQASLYQEPCDRELLEGFRQGREESFTELYDRYFPRVYAFTSRRLRNRADAEEVTQEVFTAVFRSLPSFRGDSQLLTWIFGIARNTINSQIRRERSADERLAEIDPADVHAGASVAAWTPEEHLELQRCASVLQERLGSLSEWQVDAFRLRHEQDLPIGEIARRTQRSGDAVRSSLYRVKRLLVEAVETHAAGSAPAHSKSWGEA